MFLNVFPTFFSKTVCSMYTFVCDVFLETIRFRLTTVIPQTKTHNVPRRFSLGDRAK